MQAQWQKAGAHGLLEGGAPDMRHFKKEGGEKGCTGVNQVEEVKRNPNFILHKQSPGHAATRADRML